MVKHRSKRDRLEFDFTVQTLNESQAKAIDTLRQNTVSFLLGSPGSGKSHIAIMHAIQQLGTGKYEKIYLCRPAVEACGERLGYLPGTSEEKVAAYLRPIFALIEDQVEETLRQKIATCIEIVPMAYLRGWTFKRGVCILEEAQNCTKAMLKLFVTRLGAGSKMIICGDAEQSDIKDSALARAAELLSKHYGIGAHYFTKEDIVRHPLVGLMSDTMDLV